MKKYCIIALNEINIKKRVSIAYMRVFISTIGVKK